jgi:oligoendopeptidase F
VTETTKDQYTWSLESIFPNAESWEAEFNSVSGALPELAKFKGSLFSLAETLFSYLTKSADLSERVGRLHSYAYLNYYGDTNNEGAGVLLSRADGLFSELGVRSSFFSPEVLSTPANTVKEVLASDKKLSVYSHLFEEIERYRPHTRSPEIEEVLNQLSPVKNAPEAIRTALHDAEMEFRQIETSTGDKRELSHGTIDGLLSDSDREVRRAAYQSYTDSYLKFSQTFAQTLNAQAKVSLAFSKARGFKSTFSSKIFSEGYPEDVFHAVLSACKEHRHLFKRYFKARAAVLGISKCAEYDLFAPLSKDAAPIDYETARELVLTAVKPLGDEYVSIARRGLYEERWTDVYPRPGKYSNAFSGGTYGTRPFLLLNYAPTMMEVGTLAHELGHSMHSYITNRSQPSCYASYAMSVAETASNLNQVLLRASVLKGADRSTSLAVLEEAFFFAHRYLFLMPTMSEVEHKLHTTCANGGALSATDLSNEVVRAFSEAYGGEVEFEPARLGVKWAKFCHFYSPYYFFQYAIGISAANSIGRRILAGEPGIVEKYLKFLAAGGSDYPTEIFKIVDIDITSPETYRAAFKVVEGYVERLEGYVGSYTPLSLSI